ncbi:MAG: outer membrane lipoprotein chaperone LolA [Blastocatellia bacterium]
MSIIRLRASGCASSFTSLSLLERWRRARWFAAVAATALLYLAVCAVAHATSLLATINITTQQTPDLGALIDGIQSKYSRIRGIAAEFVQVYRGNDGRTIRESGRLLLKRPSKARWDYSEPGRKLFVSDGKNVFFYVLGERHATKSTIKESVDPQIPFLFLLGRGNLRRDFSRIELVSGERPAAAGNVVLKLVPKRAPEEFKQLLVEVSPASFEVRRLVIFEQSGARMDFLLSNVQENYVASDAQFQFTPPTGVTVKQAR